MILFCLVLFVSLVETYAHILLLFYLFFIRLMSIYTDLMLACELCEYRCIYYACLVFVSILLVNWFGTHQG